jgi:hypothetical protein
VTEAVIDSVTMNVALRPPRRASNSARGAKASVNPLKKPVQLRKLRLAVDASKGLVSEWERTCGPAIRSFIVYCEQYDGIRLIQNPVSPGSAASKKLKLLGFGDNTVDKLILRISLATKDQIIVSGESDFWDPKKPHDRSIPGTTNAPVARFCREELDVTILLLRMLIAMVR